MRVVSIGIFIGIILICMMLLGIKAAAQYSYWVGYNFGKTECIQSYAGN